MECVSGPYTVRMRLWTVARAPREDCRGCCIEHVCVLYSIVRLPSRDRCRKSCSAVTPDTVDFIPNGVSTGTLQGEKHVRATTGSTAMINVGLVGRLVPVKRVDLFLEMAAMAVSAA